MAGEAGLFVGGVFGRICGMTLRIVLCKFRWPVCRDAGLWIMADPDLTCDEATKPVKKWKKTHFILTLTKLMQTDWFRLITCKECKFSFFHCNFNYLQSHHASTLVRCENTVQFFTLQQLSTAYLIILHCLHCLYYHNNPSSVTL